MANRFDSFIRSLHTLCKKDDMTTQQLIANTISWADVPSDEDDLFELEGWRAYEEVRKRAKSAYHRTIRTQKYPVQRATVKQQKPMERKPYHILRQEQTKHVISQGRVTPVKEIVEVVVQDPVSYDETDIEFITTQAFIESQAKPVEIQEETQIIDLTIPNTQITKRGSKEKLKKKKHVPTPIMYQPTFTELYLHPLLPYLGILLLFVIVLTMKL